MGLINKKIYTYDIRKYGIKVCVAKNLKLKAFLINGERILNSSRNQEISFPESALEY